MRLGTEDPLQGLQMLSVRDSSPWSPFLKAEEPQWLRRDTVVWTHTVDAECDSAPWPLPLPQGLSGAQGSPGGGQLRLAPCSPVDQAPPPRGNLALLARSWSKWSGGLGRTPSWPLLGCHTRHGGCPGHLYLLWLLRPHHLLIFYF